MSVAAFAPVPRKPVSQTVYESISSEILAGRFAPGHALPSERVLSEQFAVNRHAIREALKRLQQSGLVEISHGGATRVLDWRSHAGLDVLAQLAAAGAPTDPAHVRAILEMRLSVGADAARLCAVRAPAALIDELRALAGEDDYDALWNRIVDGSDNLAYRLALNSLFAGTEALGGKVLFHAEAIDRAARETLVEAIAAGDPDAAHGAARALLTRPLRED